MTGQDLIRERDEIKKALDKSMKKMYQNGVDFAEKQRAYRVALTQKILVLKSEGEKTTIIEKIAKGDEDIAKLEMEQNIAEVLYKSSIENIMIQKKLLDSVEDEIKREWNRN